MLGHDFKDMPSRDVRTIGANPYETVNVLRCKWCNKSPAKAREDGCAIHELEELGSILLSVFNPGGVQHFHGRVCLTCDGPIMGHYLRRGSPHYWCYEGKAQVCEGINACVYDIDGIAVPQEPECPPQ